MVKKRKSLGEWAFIIGILLAILAGLGVASLMLPANIVAVVLVILGLVVGFMNVTGKETTEFLVASIALLASGSAGLGQLPLVGEYLGPVLLYIATFVAPAVIVVALKTVFELAKK